MGNRQSPKRPPRALRTPWRSPYGKGGPLSAPRRWAHRLRTDRRGRLSYQCAALLALAVLAAFAATLVAQQQQEPSPGEAGEGAREFQFAVFGDCRPAGQRPFSPALERLASDIGEVAPEFVIGTGDYVDGSSNQQRQRWEFNQFFAAIAPMQRNQAVPVALSTGNHDLMGLRANQDIVRELFGDLYRSFNYGSCHFLILDTEEPSREGRIAGKQLQWLKQDLAAHKDARLTFVALHQPLFPVDGHVGSSCDAYPQERDALHGLFVQQGVDCVFCGHEHLYNYQKKDGVHYFITGGGGAPLYAGPERGGFHHYLLVSVSNSGYRISVRRLGAE